MPKVTANATRVSLVPSKPHCRDGNFSGASYIEKSEHESGRNAEGEKGMYRVTIQVVSHLPLTSKQKFHLNTRSLN